MLKKIFPILTPTIFPFAMPRNQAPFSRLRTPLSCLPAAALALSSLSSCQAAPAGQTIARQTTAVPKRPTQPNILFVLADDMGYADLACYGGKGVQTPNIDRLAKEGIRFTQFYVNSPICSPSRTAYTTGQYPARWNITSYIDHRQANAQRGMAQWLDLKAPTVARSLSNAGYLTGHFGKWHMGGGRDVGEAPLPTQYGFSQSLTQFEGLGDRVLAVLSAQDGQPETKMGLGVASEKLGKGKVTWAPRSQVTSAFVDHAVSFIQQAEQAGKPFYINLWPDDVHSPFDPPQQLRGDGSKRQLYRGVLSNMDAELAPLFEAIRRSPKLRNNTLVIFASDNGPERGAGLAGPFRGSKGEIYEGGIREPLIVWGPGVIPAAKQGTVNSSAVVSAVDFLPSILKVAGVGQAPAGDGTDLSATITGKSVIGRTQPLFWKRPPDRPGPANDPLPDLAVRDGNWKLLVQEDGSHAHLYDLAKDSGETNDLVAKQPQVAKRLIQSVLAWNKTLPVIAVRSDNINSTPHFELKKGDSLRRNQAPSLAGRGFTITAKIDAKAPQGVIVAQGGVAQGFSLFFDEKGHLNFLIRADREASTVVSPTALSGLHTVEASLGSNRSLTLKVDNQVVAQGKAAKLIPTQPVDGLSVGVDSDGAVGPYESPFPLNGNIESVTFDLEP
jgi:arylsulfatase A-like enzyme